MPAREFVLAFALLFAVRAASCRDEPMPPPANPNAAAEALQKILARYREILLQSPPAAGAAEKHVEALADGKWPDIDYASSVMNAWPAANHLGRTAMIAEAVSAPAHPLFKNVGAMQAVEAALDHWAAKRYQCPNWWYNEIGVPRSMRDILILLSAELKGERRAAALQTLAQYKLRGEGANLAWSAELALHYGCLTGNGKKVAEAANAVWSTVTSNQPEGIQPDGSFHQHGPCHQSFAYGRSFVSVVCPIAWQLRETPWELSAPKRAIMSHYLLDGLQWMCRGIYTVPGALDRCVSRENNMTAADMRRDLALWRDVDLERRDAIDAFIARQNGRAPTLAGFRNFPRSDFTVYHHAEGSIFLKTVSSRTYMAESINDENLKGYTHMHGGDCYVLRDGREYLELPPVWVWGLLPGLTYTKNQPEIERRAFVGAVGDGQSGLAAMDYARPAKGKNPGIAVRKCWAFHGGFVVALLGGWEAHDLAGPVAASMEQCLLREPAQIGAGGGSVELKEGTRNGKDIRWVLHNKIGYLPLGNETAVRCEKASGSWHSINLGQSKRAIELPVLRVTLALGADPKPIAYALMLGADAAKLDAAAAAPPFEIVKNEAALQCVRFKDGTNMAAFYAPGAVDGADGLAASAPCLALWTKERLWLCAPTHKAVELAVTWRGAQRKVKLPADGTSVEVKAD